jgi:3-hydroxyisobutyrate dehydrogenase-like beta-hydroxyacid dehydrogenase
VKSAPTIARNARPRSAKCAASAMAEGKFEFGLAIDWMRKDLAIDLPEA